jgi:peptide-methionine (S)-S-oxide reductase
MNAPPLLDPLFRDAVSAIDAGDVPRLERLLAAHPELVRERLDDPAPWLRDQVGNALDGFFQRPYLLWFVAEDPVRNGRLPANIAAVAGAIIRAAQRDAVASLQEQLDSTLRLVAWSWIARECGVQIALIDVLLDAGATPGETNNALVNRNVAAAEHLLARGAPPTLATALCLGRWEDVTRLARTAHPGQKSFGFVLAALNGRADALRRMLELGVDVNAPSAELYSHGTPLHHAVCSGSLESVRVLVEAGAGLDTRDSAWNGTPLGWAEYYLAGNEGPRVGKQDADIVAYLRASEAVTRPG